MQVLNNQLYVQRGEEFTLDFVLRNKDKSPYIVSSKLQNPYYLVTVSSGSQDPAKRYILNQWCMIPAAGTFFVTTPIRIPSVVDWTGFADMKAAANADGCIVANYAIYYTVDNTTGARKYYRYTGTDDSYDSSKMIEYVNRFTVTYNTATTMEWTELSYTYGIQLVSGKKRQEITSDGRQLLTFDTVYSILPPTKLVVTSNIYGSLAN